jgi:hypothetical protein
MMIHCHQRIIIFDNDANGDNDAIGDNDDPLAIQWRRLHHRRQ